MAQQFFNTPNFIYWLALALVIWAEAVTFGRWWRRRENARWTMGYFTVFLLSLPLVVWGYWDMFTWGGLFVAIGLSGAVKVGLEQHRDSRRAEKLRRHRPIAIEEIYGKNSQQR